MPQTEPAPSDHRPIDPDSRDRSDPGSYTADEFWARIEAPLR